MFYYNDKLTMKALILNSGLETEGQVPVSIYTDING